MRPNPQFPTDLVRFTKEINNGKLDFLCSVSVGVLFDGVFFPMGILKDYDCKVFELGLYFIKSEIRKKHSKIFNRTLLQLLLKYALIFSTNQKSKKLQKHI